MSATLPWTLFALGVGHILYGCVKFRAPLLEAITSGVVGKFSAPGAQRSGSSCLGHCSARRAGGDLRRIDRR